MAEKAPHSHDEQHRRLAETLLRHKELGDPYINSQTYDTSIKGLVNKTLALLRPNPNELPTTIDQDSTQNTLSTSWPVKTLRNLAGYLKKGKQYSSARIASRLLHEAEQQQSDRDAVYRKLMGLAYVYFEAGLTPTAHNEEVITTIVQRLKPIETFWHEHECVHTEPLQYSFE